MKDYWDYMMEQGTTKGGDDPASWFFEPQSAPPVSDEGRQGLTGQNRETYWEAPATSSGAPAAQVYAPPRTSSATPGVRVSGQTKSAYNPASVSDPEVNNAVRAYITQQARARGMDPAIALEIADREGGTDKYGGNEGVFPTGKSYWAYQLHYGGAGTPWASYGNTAGMGNDFTNRFGFQPGDPAGWQAAIEFALDNALRSGWQPWYGRQANPARGLREIGVWEGIPR